MFDGGVTDKALAVFEPSRRRAADALRSRPNGYWTVDEVAGLLRVHRTVAFEHLEALVRAGLATKVSVKGRRGRPSNAYRYSGATVEVSYPPRRSRLLAEILARAQSTGSDPREVARAAGKKESLGGVYQVTEDLVHAGVCIFGTVCEQARDIVCGVHAGFIEGALESAGREVAVSALGPDGSGGCRFSLD